jgi:hypothetical protein
MKKTIFTLLAVVGGITLVPDFALGHHGLAAFDQTSNVTVKGTVTTFRFVNPHCILEFEVKDEKGKIQDWEGELTSPNRLAREGWTANSLKAGDELTVTGYQAKSGAYSMWVTKLLSSTGHEIKIVGGN